MRPPAASGRPAASGSPPPSGSPAPGQPLGRLLPHATRVFPDPDAPGGVRLDGLAARCDLVLLPGDTPPRIAPSLRAGTTARPLVVFLCCHRLAPALEHAARILPDIRTPFVLVSASTDATVPRQIDRRMPPFGPAERALVASILAHPQLLRWYAENLDEGDHPLLSPLPLGLTFREGYPQDGIAVPQGPRLGDRPLRVFCAHRHRAGPQWHLRRHVTALAQGAWHGFCTVPEEELPEPAFLAELDRHAFVLCAEGGGLDPSPKAWTALLHGAIPIIRRTALAPAYAHLPVVMVEDWTPEALSADLLARWRAALAPWFDDPAGRGEILHRLSADYWWQIVATARPVEDISPIAIGTLPAPSPPGPKPAG